MDKKLTHEVSYETLKKAQEKLDTLITKTGVNFTKDCHFKGNNICFCYYCSSKIIAKELSKQK